MLSEILDPAFLRDALKAQSEAVATPDASPPPKATIIAGFDGTYARRIRVDSTGRLLLVLG